MKTTLPNTIRSIRLLTILSMIIWMLVPACPLTASTPSAATISSDSATATWSGGPFLLSNPLSCRDAELTCDHFALTIVPAKHDFVVTIRVSVTRSGDDIDLFVRDPNGNTIATSGTPGGVEEILLSNPAAGTYTVVVQPFLIVPGGTYAGVAALGSPSRDTTSQSYHGALFTSGFTGVPASTPAPSALVPQLEVSFNYVGRQAAEPTIGVNRNNAGFFAAGTFDSIIGASGVTRLARTVVMRSRDKGATWQPVSPA